MLFHQSETRIHTKCIIIRFIAGTDNHARYAHLLDNIVAVSSYAVNMDFIWEFIVEHLENIDKPPQQSLP